MNALRSTILCLLTTSCIPGVLTSDASATTADFVIAPTGNDGYPGTADKPFASLERARDAVRDLKRREPERDFTVAIRGGMYRLRRTVVFSTNDSASPLREENGTSGVAYDACFQR